MKTFFFEKVKWDIVIVNPKEVLVKKLLYQLKICLGPKKIVFLGKTFLSALLLRAYVHF
jgi:hypothetical protein